SGGAVLCCRIGYHWVAGKHVEQTLVTADVLAFDPLLRRCLMERMFSACAGIDVHKKVLCVCLLKLGPGGELVREVRSFGTMTLELLGLCDWLVDAGCQSVAMESTGVYWKPVFNLLEP